MTSPERQSLARKLGFRNDFRVTFVNPPASFEAMVGDDVLSRAHLVQPTDAEIDLAVFFAVSAADLDRECPILADRLAKAGMLWVAWPKRSSRVQTDLTFDVIQHAGLDCGLVDTKICAIDDTWSGLKFVRRLRDR